MIGFEKGVQKLRRSEFSKQQQHQKLLFLLQHKLLKMSEPDTVHWHLKNCTRDQKLFLTVSFSLETIVSNSGCMFYYALSFSK